MDTTQASLAVVQELYRRYAQGELAFVFANLPDDVLWSSSGAPERRPTAAKRSGVEGVRAYLEALHEEWTIERHDPQEFIGWGDRVAVRTSVRARHNRTGKTVEMEKVDLLTVRDGRVCSFQEI